MHRPSDAWPGKREKSLVPKCSGKPMSSGDISKNRHLRVRVLSPQPRVRSLWATRDRPENENATRHPNPALAVGADPFFDTRRDRHRALAVIPSNDLLHETDDSAPEPAPRFKRRNIIVADVKRFCHQIQNGRGLCHTQANPKNIKYEKPGHKLRRALWPGRVV
jgi:hypothetical protein